MPATTFDARDSTRRIGSFQVTQAFTTQRETTLGPGKSFRRRSAGGGQRVRRPRSQGAMIADTMRRPALRYSSAPQPVPGRSLGPTDDYAAMRDSMAFPTWGDTPLLDAVSLYHESGLADNIMVGRDLEEAQARSSSGLNGRSHIVSRNSRHELGQDYSQQRPSSVGSVASMADDWGSQWTQPPPQQQQQMQQSQLVSNERGHAASQLDRAAAPPWAAGILAPTDEYTAKGRERGASSGCPRAATPEDLDLRTRRSHRLTLPPVEVAKQPGSWDVVRKAVRPLASKRVVDRVSVKKGDGLAQPSLTHSKGPGRSTAVARKSLVTRWAYDAQQNLAKIEAEPSLATEATMEAITEQLAGALRSKVLPPGPLLKSRKAHRVAKAWLEELRPPPPMKAQDFDMLRELTKAVSSLKLKGAIGGNRSAHEQMLLDTFNSFDADHSGNLDHEEFAKLAAKLGRPMDEDTLAKSIKLVDEDGDGVVDFSEFLAWWRFGIDGNAANLAMLSAGSSSCRDTSRPDSAASVPDRGVTAAAAAVAAFGGLF